MIFLVMRKSVIAFYFATAVLLFLGPNILYSMGYYKIPFFSAMQPAFWLYSLAAVLAINRRYFKNSVEWITLGYMLLINLLTYMLFGEAHIHEALTSIVFPPLFLILLKNMEKKVNWENLVNVVYFFLIVNSILAIFEFVRGSILFPTMPNGKELYSFYFRSMALKGHPLANSGITCSVMIFVMLYCQSRTRKILLLTLGFLAILCFNSRFSLVISGTMFAIFVLHEIFIGKVKFRWRVFYTVSVFAMIALTIYLFNAGWGSRLIENGLIGDDSSMTRVEILKIFDYGWARFLTGMSSYEIDCVLSGMGFRGIVENCWILLMLRYGLPAVVFGFYLYYLLFKRAMNGMNFFEKFFVMFPWLVATSSSNSIAVGGMGICTQILLIFVFKKQSSFIENRRLYDS